MRTYEVIHTDASSQQLLSREQSQVSRRAAPTWPGLAESVQITVDPKRIYRGTLLQIYFSAAHDPTAFNSQGLDRGIQYGAAIFYKNGTEKQAPQAYVVQLEAARALDAKIVTPRPPLTAPVALHPEETDQPDDAELNPSQPYIARFGSPKIAHLKT